MIMVIGGAGFIGSSFVRVVEKPVVYDKLTYAGRLENLLNVDHTFIRGDVAGKELEDAIAMHRPAVVVNFAAESHVDRSINNPNPFLHTNVMGPVNVLELARKYDFRYVHISTDEVYGEDDADEDAKLTPSSPYSASKASADMFVRAYVRTYGTDAIIIRPSNTYGERQYPEKFIPKAIIRGLLGMEIPVYGSGRQQRNWIYVGDLVGVIKRLITEGRRGEVYNVSGDNVRTNLEILDLISKYISLKIKHVEDRPGHDIAYRMKNTKIQFEKTSLEDGLKRTVEWYKSNEWWWKPLINDPYFTKDEEWKINSQ